MKRSNPLKRRKRLNRVSPQKAKLMEVYRQQKRDSIVDGMVRCADSGLLCPVSVCEPHHVMGRHGKYLLCWVWVMKSAHERFHRFGKQSRAIGWLLSPYEGRPYDPNEKRKWPAWAETHWPQEFKRP